MSGASRSLVCRLELASIPSSVYWARHQTEDVLRAWDIAELTDIATLVVSELVTNAIRHPRVPVELTAPFGSTSNVCRIVLTLAVIPGSLFVEVYDPDPTPPVYRTQSLDAEDGRGLFLVMSLCQKVSYYQPRAGGKVVWGEIAIPGREPVDLTTLGRVHGALRRMGDGDRTS